MEEKFNELENLSLDDRASLSSWMLENKEYIQIHFRTEEPSVHLEKLKKFWNPASRGLILLDEWFEWLIDGSGTKEGSVMAEIKNRIDMIMNVCSQVLVEENNEDYEHKIQEKKKYSLEMFGSEEYFNVFLLRELCNSWKDKPKNFIYIENEDRGEVSNQPYIHVVIVSHTGRDFEKSLMISVRVGNAVFFKELSLCEALGALLEITFSFNLMYDATVDNIFNFLQRDLAGLENMDGARNKKGFTKKPYNNFKTALGAIVLKSNKGILKKLLC